MATTTSTLIPHIACKGAAEAYEFYQKAFGAEPVSINKLPDGRVMHSAFKVAGALIFMADEFPEHGILGPATLGGNPISLHLQVPDCDAVFNKAAEAGCTVAMPLQEMFWGDRYGILVDPYGHKWSVATNVREVDPAEIQEMANKMGEGECPG